jgi:hypothetical protein
MGIEFRIERRISDDPVNVFLGCGQRRVKTAAGFCVLLGVSAMDLENLGEEPSWHLNRHDVIHASSIRRWQVDRALHDGGRIPAELDLSVPYPSEQRLAIRSDDWTKASGTLRSRLWHD